MYNYFLPDEYVKNVFHIQPEKLMERGVKGIITDLDNTLVEWDRPDATAEIIEWLKSMKDVGIQVMIVSNNNINRVKAFCEPHGIPFICDARKPLRKSFKKALITMAIEKEQAVFIGDQMMTDILGGNRAGLHTILVVPVASSDGFFTKFNRMMERRIMANLKRKGMLKWEE
ncbi:YqeG family HAD IIIA-type phosphatase [Sporosarcina sp. YIM B06819]|uniref:YqeG family HAD IIIA-type phosphatase n=1 Tax=Sporosarcina sp. YIM B06819 TaxID=3081769 RepID=UPI00298CCF4F|nr:YqeG family HAD IIIA-type phosphatase [Sporosarcina sp. YIM B06819]